MSPADTAPSRTAPLALWRIAAAFLQTLHMLFGAPETVAARHTLTAKAHAHMASWLRSAEAMLRRLILIEASAYPKPNTRPLLHARRPRTRKLMTFSPDAPEAWRVSFRCFLHRRRLADDGRGKGLAGEGAGAPSEPSFIFREDRRAPQRRAKSLSVAKRSTGPAPARSKRRRRQDRLWMEHEPKLRFRSAWPLAERYEALLRVFNDPAPYARRVAARLHATPHRLAEVLRASPEAHHRVDRFEALGEQARDVWRAHFSSS